MRAARLKELEEMLAKLLETARKGVPATGVLPMPSSVFLTNTNGNARADVLNLMRAATTLHPTVIHPGVEIDGRLSHRLGALAAANGIVQGSVHDAESDARRVILPPIKKDWRRSHPVTSLPRSKRKDAVQFGGVDVIIASVSGR